MSDGRNPEHAMDTPPHSQTTIFLRPIGSALPLGFFSFAIGMLLLGCQALGWLQHSSPPGQTSMTVGVYLFGFAAAALLLSTLSTMGKPFFSVLLLLATTRMVLGGLYEVGAAGKTIYEISGGFALGLTLLAMYGGAALGLEDAHQREILPLFRRAAAAESFAGYERQLQRLEAEAGVRQQL